MYGETVIFNLDSEFYRKSTEGLEQETQTLQQKKKKDSKET